MNETMDALALLREGLLAGTRVLLAGAPGSHEDLEAAGAERAVSRAHPVGSLAQAVGAACARLGAQVDAWEPPDPGGDVDVLVVDGAAMFAFGDSPGAAGEPPARDALSGCLKLAWQATATVANDGMLNSGDGGRIVFLAPAPDAGEHSRAATAGLENLARTLSIEWARHGVTPVAIAPGANSSPDEVAALTAYLASPAGAYFSGCMLDLRGPGG